MQDSRSEKLTDRYNRDAGAYRDLWAPILRVASKDLLRELAGGGVKRVVDVGTGVGALVLDVKNTFPGAAVFGVDRAYGMLKLAPATVPRAVMDAGQLAIRSGSMDLALMVFMLFHMDSPVEGLREARRVLRQGGRVATLTWGLELESEADRVWAECLEACGASEGDPKTAAYKSVDTPDKMETLFQVCGYQSVRSWAEDLAVQLDLERFLQLKTSLGISKQRCDSLDSSAREDCVSDARRRMQELSSEDFKVGGSVVFAVAEA